MRLGRRKPFLAARVMRVKSPSLIKGPNLGGIHKSGLLCFSFRRKVDRWAHGQDKGIKESKANLKVPLNKLSGSHLVTHE